MNNLTVEGSFLNAPITKQISRRRIADLLVGAFEGGSNYWITKYQKVKPTETVFEYDGGQYPLYQYPLNPGGAVIIWPDDDDNKQGYRLDLDSIQKGLQVMIELQPDDFARFLMENDDAGTSDTFLQLCLFGRVVYG